MSHYSASILQAAKHVTDRVRSAIAKSTGVTLLETVIALAMFSSAGTAVLMGVSAAHTSSDRVEAHAIDENLARNQMEYVLSLEYVAPGGNYASVADDVILNLTIPSGYSVSAVAETYLADDGFTGSIENVVITVSRDAQSVLILESLRVEP